MDFLKKVFITILKKRQGCSLCSKPSKLTKEMFIEKSNKIHGKTYDYSETEYIHGKEKIKIKCNKHGIFEMLPINHLKGQKCPTCSGRNKVTNELFIEKAKKIHGDKYDYSQIEYVNAQTKIKIICREHGEFIQMPLNHLKGNQCYRCSGIVKTTEDFIYKANKVHNNLYDYSKTNYKTTRSKIIIICKSHGEFTQSPNDHLNGNGCQKCCSMGFSKIAIEWLDSIIKKENIFIQHALNIGEFTIDKYKIDGYCKETNTCYEFNGSYYHGEPRLYDDNVVNNLVNKTMKELYDDTIKRENYIKSKNFNLVVMWELDWDKFVKKK